MQAERENIDVPLVEHPSQLILDGEYEQVQTLIQENPELLDYRDEHDATLFHTLCWRVREGAEDEDAAIALAKRMLALRPELAMEVNSVGRTALHCCVRPSRVPPSQDSLGNMIGTPSTRLTILLIEANPNAINVVETQFRATPFHFACYAGTDISVLRLMLEMNPSLASTLCQMTMTNGNAFLNTPVGAYMYIFITTIHRDGVNDKFDKMILLVNTTYYGKVVDDETNMDFFAHKLCSYPYPFATETEVANEPIFRTQLPLRDDNGNLPIHLAVQSVFIDESWANQHPQALERARTEWADNVARILRVNPDMALEVDGRGRLPMFLALDCTGMAWNGELIVKLAKECPRVLYERDEATMLKPALYAAMRADESPSHLSVVFELFRETPDLASHALAVSDGHD